MTGRNMLRWAFEAAEGLGVQRVRSQWRWWGLGWKRRGWEDQETVFWWHRFLKAQCMGSIGWGVPVGTGAKTGVVGIET